MKAQLKSMGLSLDWSREIATCDPAYYKHQQKMFLDFLRAGLVERRKSKVNWDPVDHDRARQRAGDRRPRLALRRHRRAARADAWFFKITDYSQDLLDALDTLDRWPEKVRLMQKTGSAARKDCWSGSRSTRQRCRMATDELEVFTTRPDTLFGAKFMAVAPDHPLAAAAAAKQSEACRLY